MRANLLCFMPINILACLNNFLLLQAGQINLNYRMYRKENSGILTEKLVGQSQLT
jgi:hypothetical protein